VEVRVVDDGTAAAPDGHHGHGIDGMRERAALHHGTLSAGPAPGGGWLVAAVLHPESRARAVTT
jgi:signal transduction histidine kinase